MRLHRGVSVSSLSDTSTSDVASHGVAVIEVDKGRISSWREYFESGPSPFERFVEVDGKNWEWTVRQLVKAVD